MKYRDKEISQLWDNELLAGYSSLLHQENERNKAASHEKFNKDRNINGRMVKKLEFPPANPAFLKLKQEMLNEINKRKLKT